MSNDLLRRNSSKQGLQNLMRLMAQRSIEDAEEVERERRRRARDASRWTDGSSLAGEFSLENEALAEENMYNSDLKPNSSPSLEEDEGFSDWTQRRQQRVQELNREAEEVGTINKAAETIQPSITSSRHLQRGDEVDERELERRKEHEEVMYRRTEESQDPEVGKRKEVKISYTSKVFLHQEPKHEEDNGDTAREETTSYIKSTRVTEPEEANAILETEQRLERIRQSLQQKESQELDQLRHRQAEAEQELEELNRRREERRRLREEEEHCREQEQQQRLAQEEEERRRMKKDIERRRMEAAERMKSLTLSSMDRDETFSPFSPKTPTHKITERTESLNRSLKKSNSFKKTQPLALLPKIDDKMEQYTHAVENSQEVRSVKASLNDLHSSPEVIASKKTLFETEAWNQGLSKGATCKDAEGLRVGVANLIDQWVKGQSETSRQSSCRVADVKTGDVMQKKNMWEVFGDTSGQPDQRGKASAVGKKYKFVITGHGKYEKIAVDDNVMNGKSDSYHGC